MPHEYAIEFSEPSTFRCDCCGGLTVRLSRFVYRDGAAFAVYFAAYSNNHPDEELAMLVSLGNWGEGSVADGRSAFYCRVRPIEESYGVSLGDGASSAWRDADIVGAKLSRAEALVHPWKTTAFEVLDEAFLRDPSLLGFLQRARCGAVGVPLEKSFAMPDDVAALGEERATRAEVRRNFVALDGERFFVRCLLPIPVESYGSWCIGLWIEVSKADYARIDEAWDDTEKYSGLHFSGRLANDLRPDLDRPIAVAVEVDVHVPDAGQRPRIRASRDRDLGNLLAREWPQPEFEAYAVSRGML